mgnify:CR=1 FL=1
MAKHSNSFTCTACSQTHGKWIGKCEGCGAWNTLIEEAPLSSGPKALGSKGRSIHLTDLATQAEAPPRASSGIDELDRVLGGGLVIFLGIWVSLRAELGKPSPKASP